MNRPSPKTPTPSKGQPAIPRMREVRIYFSEKELPPSVATAFYQHYSATGWTNRAGKPVNWKQVAFRWQWRVYRTQPWLFRRQVRKIH